MSFAVLNPEIQRFIDANIGADPARLALQKNPFPEDDWIGIVAQIAAKAKARDKLPTWFGTRGIIYPPKVSIEQTSSEKTARYKSELVSGQSLIDLTGGFGVDDFYFARQLALVVHCEINPELSALVAHNFTQLAVANIDCVCGDSADILKRLDRRFDWIYLDPSRRNDAKGKVFLLADCLPDVPGLLDFYLEYTDNILIKTAPILDIAAGLSELKHVRQIHIVAVDNEVKELLWIVGRGDIGTVAVKTANLTRDRTQVFEFALGGAFDVAYSLPRKYLYEPNAAIMKSGGFDAVAACFGLFKLHRHSHLYTSDERIDFPGRIFEIAHRIGYQKSDMKAFFENKRANVTARNFPDSVETIRKKWKIRDGGTDYCFFTTDADNRKIVLICAKIQ